MIYVLLAYMIAGIVVLVCLYRVWRIRKSRQTMHQDQLHRIDYDHVTPTGETFEERKYYHDHGTLSPGEIAIAHAIRDRVKDWNVEEGNNEAPLATTD